MGVEQYKELFVAESEEHLQIINNSVLSLEKDPANLTILNEIFRCAHTLKGMSATMGFESLTRLTHKMEDVLDIFRSQKIPVTSEVVDKLFSCLDILQMLLEEIKTGEDLNLDIESIILQLQSVTPNISSAELDQKIDEKKELLITALEKEHLLNVMKDKDTRIYKINISLSHDCQLKSVRAFMVFNKLNSIGEIIKSVPSSEELESNHFGLSFCLLLMTNSLAKKIEQILSKVMEVEKAVVTQIRDINLIPLEKIKEIKVKDTVQTGSADIDSAQQKDLAKQFGFKKIQSIRVSTQRLDKLMNFVGELVISKIRLMQIAQTHQLQPLNEILTNIDRLTGDLQDEVMQARLIPMAQVFDRFPRMVRDLARSEKKQINFDISGGEIELDRTVLDEIADPLVHLLRNSVDHGIELPSVRKENNKNPVGTIKLSAYRERTFVLIEVSDDGKGIDPATMREVAVKKGFMTEEELAKLSDRDILNLITMPGFSSTSEITDTSGRGVGMDVVKMKIESLGGSLVFDSVAGKGSNFKLKLPLTVAIIRAMLVEINKEIYATPIASIVETVKVSKKRIKHIEKFEVINLRDEVLPLLRLEKILGVPIREAESSSEDISIVVVDNAGKKAGLVVDRVVGQQEVVIKTVGSLLKGIKGFSGATILGDGSVALILDVATLVG
ncbi:MAG: chemotaxis protein CheA [Candidatus Omnitrophica bacterium]|nr:chemotaxis protein CheA [Candidatus Omnitrophota bacterium]